MMPDSRAGATGNKWGAPSREAPRISGPMLRGKPPPASCGKRLWTCSQEKYRLGRAPAISGPDPILIVPLRIGRRRNEEALAVQPDLGDQRPAGHGDGLRGGHSR